MSLSTRFTYRSLSSVLLIYALVTPCLSQDGDAPTDYDSMSVESLVELATKGDAVAQRTVGLRCYRGTGIHQDLEKANGWFRLAAKQGDLESQYQLGSNALNGWGMEKDVAEARRLLTSAANGGIAQAQNQLGTMCERGLGAEADMGAAVAWYRKAAERGVAAAQSNYGTCLIQGRGIDRNLAEGVKWLRKSAEQRDPNGLHNYAYAWELGWTGRRDIARAVDLYKQAAQRGYKDAIAKLKRLAESGHPDAQFEYGTLFEYGIGIEKDFTAARQWYQKGAAQDHTPSIVALGTSLQYGAGGPKDIPKAIELYNKAAQRGNALALNRLGECYFSGTGVEEDKQRAVTLVKMAARQGLPEAITNQGWALATGSLGAPDPEQGAELFYRAAVLGHKRGLKLLRELADGGHEAAKTYLKKIESGDTTDVSMPRASYPEVDVSRYSAKALATMRGMLKLLRKGNMNDAIDGLYEYTQEHPGDDIAWNMLGMAYKKKGMSWEAKVAMDKAIAANPTNQKYYILKAGFLTEKGRFHEAAEMMEKAAEHVPPSLPFLAALVQVESKAKRFRHVVEYGNMLWALRESSSAASQLAVAHHFLENRTERDRYVDQYRRLGGRAEKLTDIFATSERLKKEKPEILKTLQRIGAGGDVKKMNEQTLRYLDYDPLALELWVGLGMFYLNDRDMFPAKKVREAVAKYRNCAKAIELLSTAAYFEEGDVKLHQKLAQALVDNGEFGRAQTQYRKTMKLFPKVASTYSYAALLELKIGNHEEAVRLAEKARQIADKNPEVTAWLATVYHYTGDVKKRDHFRRVTAGLTDKDPEATFGKFFAMNKYWDYGYYGNSAIAQHLVERICEYTKFVAARDMGTEKYQKVMGDQYEVKTLSLGISKDEMKWQRRQLARACRAYLKEYPKSFYIQTAYGHMCSVLGRFEEADTCFKRSIEINPDCAWTYSVMGLSRYSRNDLSAAVKYYSKAHEKDPTTTRGPDVQGIWRGHWLENDRNFRLAIKLMTVFWEADPTNPAVAGRIAEAYHHLGDIEKRDEFIEHARKLNYKEMDRLDDLVAGKVAFASEMFRELKASPEIRTNKTGEGAPGLVDVNNRNGGDSSQQRQDAQPADSAFASTNALSQKENRPARPAGHVEQKPTESLTVVSKPSPVAKGRVRIQMAKYYLDVPKDWVYTGHDSLRGFELPKPFECVVIPRERVLGTEGTRLLIMTDTVAGVKSSEAVAAQAKKMILGQLTSPKVVEQEQIKTGGCPAWRIRVQHKDSQAGELSDDDFYLWHCDKENAILVWCMTLAGEERRKYGKQFTEILHSLRHKTSHASMFDRDLKETTDEKAVEPEERPQGRYLPRCDASDASKAKCKQADKLVKQGKYAEAIRLYNEAIRLDRGHVCAYTGIGLAEGLRGRKQTAMDQLNRTVDMFPDSALALIERGRFALTINRVDITEKDADKAIKLSYCGQAYELRAYCFLERGQDKSAISYLDMAIKVYPDSSYAFRLRARAHRGLRNQSQAAADDKRAAELETAKKPR